MIVLAALLALLGVLAMLRHPRRASGSTEPDPEPHAPLPPPADERSVLRSYALDVLGESVLILDHDGRVRDCNSSALTMFDRHRASIQDQYATSLRRFEGIDQGDPHRIASQQTLWVGEGWARQPDGGVKLCLARVIAIRDARGQVTGFVESYRDVTAERALSEEFRDLLYGVRAFDSVTAEPRESARAVQYELRVLSEAFRDIDLIIRQYERLLPSLGADDPLTESIAGLAHDTRAAVASGGVPALLEEIPRSLTRLRGHLQQLTLELNAESDRSEAAGTPSSTGT